ncbi:MAG: hypothetical protein IMHGJWDQ_000506 [Candidatus Fervidibacter sp.]|mgnify:CR=1 FL=1
MWGQSWLVALLLAPVNLLSAMVAPAPEWERLFRPAQGWLGGDCAYSVPLGADRFLWLFDDTFIGRREGNRRVGVKMVRNSIALQAGRAPATATVRFVWGKKANEEPTDFLSPPDGVGWLWFGDGLVAANRLWLFLWQFEATNTPSPFNFRLRASWLAEVANYADEPEEWQFRFYRLPFFLRTPEQVRCFGNAVLVHEGWVFVYGVAEDRRTVPLKRGLTIARVPAERLADFSAWRFYRNGRWTDKWASAAIIGDDLGFEFTVQFVPAVCRFLLVYSPADLASVVKIRWASSPTGEWSKPRSVYECPQRAWHPSVFCYAAKGHAALSGEGELLVTYASNAFEFRLLLEDARLYFPHFVRLRFNRTTRE